MTACGYMLLVSLDNLQSGGRYMQEIDSERELDITKLKHRIDIMSIILATVLK